MEILNRHIIDDTKDILHLYVGFEPSKSPSIGYLSLLKVLADLIKSKRYQTTILIADVHVIMGKGIEMRKGIKERIFYYQFILTTILKALGVDKTQYSFKLGSSFQLETDYMFNLMSLMAVMRVSDAKKAVSEVIKEEKDPILSTIIYPLMQIIDEISLDADVELGGMDQRKIFTASLDFKGRLRNKKTENDSRIRDLAYILNPLIPSLKKGSKMNSSDTKGKIGFLDTDEEIIDKIKGSFCVDGDCDLSTNPCLSIMKYIIYPILGNDTRRFGSTVREGYTHSGFASFDHFLLAWAGGEIKAQSLKADTSKGLIEIVTPIREVLLENIELYNEAYPVEK